MIRNIAKALVLAPLAILIVSFAVANRSGVVISFDPFSPEAPALAVTLPLFLVIMIALMAGVIVGGAASWLKGAKWRNAVRRLAGELRRVRNEAGELQRRLDRAGPPAPPSIASIAYRRPPAA